MYDFIVYDYLRPLKDWFSHVDRRWGHISLLVLEQSVQLGMGWVRGQKVGFLWFPMPKLSQNPKTL